MELRALILKAGYSFKEFAQKVGVNQQAVSYWVRSGGRPKYELLPIIAEVLGVSIETIVCAFLHSVKQKNL